MNIFYLNRDPVQCAKDHCDKHCVKMLLEYAQLMSTAHRVHDNNDDVYQIAHLNHPSTIWTRESLAHYQWLFQLWHHLNVEYTARYDKVHASAVKLYKTLMNPPVNIPDNGFKDPPLCMPDQYKQDDAVEAYRDLYRYDKSRFAVWAYSDMPDWYNL